MRLAKMTKANTSATPETSVKGELEFNMLVKKHKENDRRKSRLKDWSAKQKVFVEIDHLGSNLQMAIDLENNKTLNQIKML